MPVTGVAIGAESTEQDASGVPVAEAGAPAGALVDGPGMLQYGRVLFGGTSAAKWRNLAGWRGSPATDVSDTPRPLAHGSYAGLVTGQSQVVTFDYLVRGMPAAKAAAIDVLEEHLPIDGVERPLVVHDGTGAWVRMARVVAREVPQDAHYRHGPVACSVQFLCADPRRYALAGSSLLLAMPSTDGGLDYPLDYPLAYGEVTTGTARVRNAGSVETPLRAIFRGPLLRPSLSGPGWLLAFTLNLADGETLHVDTSAGTVLLNGRTDRLEAVAPASSPIELCTLPPGATDLSLAAAEGSGTVSVAYAHARL